MSYFFSIFASISRIVSSSFNSNCDRSFRFSSAFRMWLVMAASAASASPAQIASTIFRCSATVFTERPSAFMEKPRARRT